MQKSSDQLSSLKLVRTSELTSLLGISRTSLWAWRKAGTFPSPVRLGSCVGWILSDVSQYLQEKKEVANGRR